MTSEHRVGVDPALVDAVAYRVVELLREGVPARTGLVDAQAVADALGISRDFVYRHAEEFGAVAIGQGRKRARLRFDLERARAALVPVGAAPAVEPVVSTPRRKRQSPAPVGTVLASRPRDERRAA